jgi:trans-aconitate methyltransferase
VRVLDYGCGTSLFGRVLLNRHPDWSLWLCDVDGYHLQFALSECRRMNPATQVCIAPPGTAVPAFPAGLDVIHAFACFEHIPNVYDVLCGLWAALKPGGHLLETFAGETGCEPPADSSDAASAWAQRDACFTFLLQNGALVDGSLPPLTAGGHYAEDEQLRVWRKRLP